MCGRARCSLTSEQICKKTGLPAERWVDLEKYKPSYNVSPGAWTPVLKRCSGSDELHTMKWGLVPSFTKKGDKLDHWRMFNARSETVSSKSVFSRLLFRHRCVVLINGFYEWKAEGSKKQPYYISFGEDEMLMLAGLYDCYTDEHGTPLFTYTILTVDSSKPLTWLHDRMPVLLATPKAVDAWLDASAESDALPDLLQKVCVPFGGPQLTWHPVTTDMNKPGYDKPDACKNVRDKKGTMSAFFKPMPKKDVSQAAAPSSPVATKLPAGTVPASPQYSVAQPVSGKTKRKADTHKPAAEIIAQVARPMPAPRPLGRTEAAIPDSCAHDMDNKMNTRERSGKRAGTDMEELDASLQSKQARVE